MTRLKHLITLPVMSVTLLIGVSGATACACCATPHTGFERVLLGDEIRLFLATLKKDVRSTSGEINISKIPFDVDLSGSDVNPIKKTLKARFFVSDNGQIVISTQAGDVRITPSSTIKLRATDIAFITGRPGASGADLLKENELNGMVRFSGQLKELAGAKVGSARLTLLGTGNNCIGPKEMRKWTLVVRANDEPILWGFGLLLPKS